MCTNLVAFILPPILFMRTRSISDAGAVKVFSAANAPCFAVLIFGVISLLVSSQQILASFSKAA